MLLLEKECLIFGLFWCVVLVQTVPHVLSACSGFGMEIPRLKMMVILQSGIHGRVTTNALFDVIDCRVPRDSGADRWGWCPVLSKKE